LKKHSTPPIPHGNSNTAPPRTLLGELNYSISQTFEFGENRTKKGKRGKKGKKKKERKEEGKEIKKRGMRMEKNR